MSYQCADNYAIGGRAEAGRVDQITHPSSGNAASSATILGFNLPHLDIDKIVSSRHDLFAQLQS